MRTGRLADRDTHLGAHAWAIGDRQLRDPQRSFLSFAAKGGSASSTTATDASQSMYKLRRMQFAVRVARRQRWPLPSAEGGPRWSASHISDSGPNKVPSEMEEH